MTPTTMIAVAFAVLAIAAFTVIAAAAPAHAGMVWIR
jgi:hypothetical protein